MAPIYHFTSSVMNHYRGRVAARGSEGKQEQALPRETRDETGRGSRKVAQRPPTLGSLQQAKRAPLTSLHCVNVQAVPHPAADALTPAACNRLAALSLHPARPRIRPHEVPKIVLHLVPEAASAPFALTPQHCSSVSSLAPPQSHEQVAALRPRTLRPTRLVRSTAQMSLPQAQERASLAMIAQKLRLGLNRMQNAGSSDALLCAMAQVEQSAGSDVHLTSTARSQVITLLLYLGDVVDGSESVSFFEALQHIEELTASRSI